MLTAKCPKLISISALINFSYKRQPSLLQKKDEIKSNNLYFNLSTILSNGGVCQSAWKC